MGSSGAVILLLLNLLIYNAASVIVKTEQGSVRGEYLEAVTGNFKYASFKGIPFAKPPLGDLRFRAPQPPEPWEGVRNATQHGPVCLQKSLVNGGDSFGEEDCLYLNVYTPNINPKHPLPVMLFIHGGGYQKGSGNSERYGPDYLVTQNVILVTSNHRLGPLGYLSLNNKDVPGNAGLKDQVATLRWIQKNIANFGGDPNKVTLIGQSTGAASIGLHNISPMSKGLYQRSLQMSCSPFTDFSIPCQPRRIAFRLAQQLGCWTRDDQELMEFLKSVPAKKLLSTDPAILWSQEPKNTLKRVVYPPVVESNFGQERFLTIHPAEALKNGMINDVDLLLGHTAIEGIVRYLYGESKVPELYTNYTEMIVPREILESIPPAKMFPLADKIHAKYFGTKQIDNNTAKELVKFLSDIPFNYALVKYAMMFSKYRKTFMYKFSRNPEFPRHGNTTNEFGTTGPMHDDDLLYVFNPGNKTVDKTTDDFRVIKKVTTLYTNFAKYGNPTPDDTLGVKWPEYNTSTAYYLDIDTKLTVHQHLDAEAVKFWDSIYKEAGLEY